MFLAIFGLVALAVVGSVIAFSVANGRETPSTGTNSNEGACAVKCEQIQARRSDVCGAAAVARAAEAGARRAEAAHAAALGVMIATAAIAAALWLSSLIPLVGLAVIPAAIAATYVAGLAAAAEAIALSAMLGAQTAAGRATNAEAVARQREQEAIAIMRQSCPAAEVDACLARPRPC